MHHALEIQELVRRICRELDHGGLAVMARVQNSLGNTALDILWETVDVGTLLYIFPSHCFANTQWGKEFTRFPSNKDWDRYALYAPRVKTLSRSSYDPYAPRVNFVNVLTILRPRGCLVNLRYIKWNHAYSEEFLKMRMFLVPSLKTVELTVYSSYERPTNLSRAEIGLTYAERVGAPLQELIDLRISLRKLELPIPENFSKPLAILYQTKWPSLMTANLVTVVVVASKGLLRRLSILPYLTTLSYRFCAEENATQIVEEIADPFPRLEELNIHGAESLRDVTSAIKETGCIPSSAINIECNRTPTGYKVSQLLNSLFVSGRGRSIHIFSLEIKLGGDGEIDEVGDVFPDIIVTLDHLRPLFSLDMHLATISIGYSLSISDEQFRELVLAWPTLIGLKLCSRRSPLWYLFPPVNTVSLRGLNHLASLAYASIVSIELNITDEDVRSLPAPAAVSTCPLSILDVMGSNLNPEAVTPVGNFLADLFPQLVKIYYADLQRLHLEEDKLSPWYRLNEVLRERRAS